MEDDMSVTKEQLTERLDSLKTQKEQMIQQLNAVAGAIQVTEDILKVHYTEESNILLPDARQAQAVQLKQPVPFPVKSL
jgi:hypothetical protein